MTSIVDRVREQAKLADKHSESLAAEQLREANAKAYSFTRSVLTDMNILQENTPLEERDGFIWLEGVGYCFEEHRDWERMRFGVTITDGTHFVYHFIYADAYRMAKQSTSLIKALAHAYDELAAKHNPPPPPPPPQLVKFETFNFGTDGEAELSKLLDDGWKIKKISDPVGGFDGVVYATLVHKDK